MIHKLSWGDMTINLEKSDGTREQGLLYFGSQTEPACKLEDIVSMDKEDLDI
jgi:hypothetical protein